MPRSALTTIQGHHSTVSLTDFRGR